jgi:hypothetical protein
LCVDLDPRLHFALNCGARSCPPIKLFTPQNLDDGLSLAAAAFCESEVQVHDKVVSLSRILMWYGGDFAADEEGVLKRVAGYMEEGSVLRGRLEETLKQGGWQVQYRDYDWSTNSAEE